MAIIKITKKDIDRRNPIESGWYPAIVKSVDDELNKKKSGVNTIVTLLVNEGDETKEREMKVYLPNDYPGLAISIAEAILDCNITEAIEINPSKWLNAKLYVEVVKSIYKNPDKPNDSGIPVNNIINYQPFSKPPF